MRKYLKQDQNPYPHMGNMLAKVLQSQKMTKVEAARRIGVSPTTFSAYLNQQSLQAGIIWKASLAFGHDFFSELVTALPTSIQRPVENPLVAQIQALQSELKDLQKENVLYKNLLTAKLNP